MQGTNAATGQALGGVDHLRQSIADILATPIGSRVMRRSYGSRLFELIDAPLNGATLIDIYAATVEALIRWEPRIKVTNVQASRPASGGKVELFLEGVYLPDGSPITMDGIVI